jgi:hypothetical protein
LFNNVLTFSVIVDLSNVNVVPETLSLLIHVVILLACMFQTNKASASFKSARLLGILLKSVKT